MAIKRLLYLLGSASASAAVIFSRNADRNTSRISDTGNESEVLMKAYVRRRNIASAINQARELTVKLKNEIGAPGIVVGVSVDGEVVWKEGIGFADLENQVLAHEDTAMRIASISKSLTAAVVGRLLQEGVIDIDQPIQKYVPSFPVKMFGDKKVTITTRQLMSHLAGIRHYSKKKDSGGSGDGQFQEFYSKERFETIEKALSIFKDDALLHAPGSKYLYTTYGWTLVSAVMEGATGKTYPQLMRVFLRQLGMRRTYLDEPEPIIYGRSKCYMKSKNGRIMNAPYVDNSCKWAGGGFLSTVGDLLKFANAMLFSYQFDDNKDSSDSVTVKINKIIGIQHDNSSVIKETALGLKKPEEIQEITMKKRLEKKHVIDSREISKTTGNYGSSGEKNVSEGVGSTRREESSSMDDQKKASEEKGISDAEGTGKTNAVANSFSSGLKNATKAAMDAGSYVWNNAWQRDKSSNMDDQKKTSEDKGISDVEGTGKTNAVANYFSAGLKNATKGATDAGSYVWNSGWQMFGWRGDKSSSMDDQKKASEEKGFSDVEDTGKTNAVANYFSAGLKNATKGATDAGSYVWNSGWKMFGWQEDKSSSMDDQKKASEEKGFSDVEDTGKTNAVANYFSAGLKNATKGATDAGSYVWNNVWQRDKSSNMDDQKKASEDKGISDAEDTGKTIAVPNSFSSGLKNATKGATDAGSYVWNSGWQLFGWQEDKSGKTTSDIDKEKAYGMDKQSGVEGSLSSGRGYLWKKAPASFNDDEAKKSSDEEKKSWTTNFKNLFNPKAMDNELPGFVLGLSGQSESKSSCKCFQSPGGTRNHLWFDCILPTAVNAVFGVKCQVIGVGNKSLDTIPLPSVLPEIFGLHNHKHLHISRRGEPLCLMQEEKHSDAMSRSFLKGEHGCDIISSSHRSGYAPDKPNKENNAEGHSLGNPYILPSTIALLWTHVDKTRFSDWGPYAEGGYGLGFGVAPAVECPGGVPDGGQPFMVGHTGGAVGASSAMLIIPRDCNHGDQCPKGVAVVILTNLQSVSLNPLAIEIARIFGQTLA